MSNHKQKYIFIKDDQNLSSKEVEKLKDFNSLKANYNIVTKPLSKVAIYKYKNKKIFLGLILIAVIVYLLFFLE